MCLKVLFGALCFFWCYFSVVSGVAMKIHERTGKSSKYSIEELLSTVFPTKTSSDLDLDPCKAGMARDCLF